MDPRLAVISGPLRGETFEIECLPLSIGRVGENHIELAESRVSRFHCEIHDGGDSLLVRDLDSTNGTFVNGRPVREQSLEEGDQISVGSTVFVFLQSDSSPESVELRFDDGSLDHITTTQLGPGQVFQSSPAHSDGLPGAAERARHDLRVLLQMSAAINSISSVGPLIARLLELLFDIVPAETGCVLLGSGVDSLEESHTRSRSGESSELVVSRTLLNRVFEDGNSILSGDLAGDESIPQTESLDKSGACSVLCVPLQLYERTLGALYLQTGDPTAPFDEHHLHLATAAASSAAVALENARRIQWLEGENVRLKADLDLKHSLVGQSTPMQEVVDFISRVAPTDSTVLIGGENGTGKELVARAIHANSERAGGPFVAINCATLSEALLESELFGHEKGAFTGAVARKKGKLEEAHHGTLLLDEAGDLALPLQARLLRVLQEREFERVGGTRPLQVDVRVVASTNHDLKQAVADGHFRQDLYYRLNVVSLNLPPLRDRKEDIPLLTQHFLQKCAAKCRRSVEGVSPRARDALLAYDWPGNVRELENAIERALVLGTSAEILVEDLPDEVRDSTFKSGSPSTFQESLLEKKRQLVREAVRRADGNLTRAAGELGLHPNYLHRLINNLKLRDELRGGG